jgi:hypothetical protein
VFIFCVTKLYTDSALLAVILHPLQQLLQRHGAPPPHWRQRRQTDHHLLPHLSSPPLLCHSCTGKAEAGGGGGEKEDEGERLVEREREIYDCAMIRLNIGFGGILNIAARSLDDRFFDVVDGHFQPCEYGAR